MTNEEIAQQVTALWQRVGRTEMTIPSRIGSSLLPLDEEVYLLCQRLVSQAYEDAERAVFDEHCRCGVTYLSGKEHHADCPVRCVRALKDSLASQPAASAS